MSAPILIRGKGKSGRSKGASPQSADAMRLSPSASGSSFVERTGFASADSPPRQPRRPHDAGGDGSVLVGAPLGSVSNFDLSGLAANLDGDSSVSDGDGFHSQAVSPPSRRHHSGRQRRAGGGGGGRSPRGTAAGDTVVSGDRASHKKKVRHHSSPRRKAGSGVASPRPHDNMALTASASASTSTGALGSTGNAEALEAALDDFSSESADNSDDVANPFPAGTLFHHWTAMCLAGDFDNVFRQRSAELPPVVGGRPSDDEAYGRDGRSVVAPTDVVSSSTKTFSTGVKLVIEQYYENFFRSQEERGERANILKSKMDKLGLTAEEKEDKFLQLARRETEHMRSRRIRLTGNKFECINIIGRGAFGEVRLVKMVGSNYLYAMKKLSKTKIVEMNQVAHVRAERDALADNNYFYNKNPWVVSLYYSFQDSKYLYLVMEYVPGGDLMNLLIKLGTFTSDMARFYIAEILLAIDSIHQLHYIHRDIKPDNILLDRNGHVKLSDFGLCTGLDAKQHKIQMYKKLQMQAAREADSSILLADGQMSRQERFESWSKKRKTLAFSNVGTPDYMAPEIIFEEGYNRACDYWSVGVIMFEMLVGYPPFYAETQREIRQKIMEWRKYVRVPDGVAVSAPAKDLLSRLLCDQSVRAANLDVLKKNPWFSTIQWRSIRKKRAPMVPQLKSPTDTSYFDKFDEEDDRESQRTYAPPKDSVRRFYSKDIPFIGYTYRNFKAVRV